MSDNKKDLKQTRREYYLKNRERLIEINKIYYKENREKALEYSKMYQSENREKYRDYLKEYFKTYVRKKSNKKFEQLEIPNKQELVLDWN